MKKILPLALLLLASCVSPDRPDSRAVHRYMKGVNLANFLEVPPGGGWSVPHDARDLREIRAQGFDHIRLPIAWNYYTGPAPDYQLSPDIFDKVDYIALNATKLGLNVMINIHNFNDFMTNPAGNTEKFCAIWRQIAAHYAKAPPGVAFELLNEPHDRATTEIMNPLYERVIGEIRKTNPRRTIFVEPGDWGSPKELKNLRVPEQDKNIIVSVHCYNPMFFTHQGASWVKSYTHLAGVHFPGPPETPLELNPDYTFEKWVVRDIERYNTLPAAENPSSPRAFMPLIDEAIQYSKETGRPIHFGEFGAFMKADQPSRARYYAAVREAFDKAGFGWAIWDWKSGFNYWDPRAQRPLPGMREALFPGH